MVNKEGKMTTSGGNLQSLECSELQTPSLQVFNVT